MTFFGTLDQAKPLMEGEPLTSDIDVNGNALIGVRLIEGLLDIDLFINSGQNIEYGVPTGFQFNIGVGGNYKQSITESEMTVSVPINFNGPPGEIRTNNINGNISIIPDGIGKVLIGGNSPTIRPAVAGIDLNIDSNRIGFPTFTGKINLHGYTNHPVVIWEGPGEGNPSLHFQSNTVSPGPYSATISSNGAMQIRPNGGLFLSGGSGDLEFQAGTLGLVFNVNGESGANTYVKFREASSGEEFFTLKYMTDAPNIKVIKIEKTDLPFDFNTNEIQNAGKINSSANALPVASATYRGQIRTLEGGAGARDKNYLCLKSDAGAYYWVEVANGGA